MHLCALSTAERLEKSTSQVVLCAVENSAEHVQSIQFAVARRGARSKTHMLLIVGAVVC
jgi:hypothetical protein